MKLTNIKRRLRSDSAGYRAAVLKTGGGPAPTVPVLRSEGESALYHQIALSVDGLPTIGDSDEIVYETEYLESENEEDEKDDEIEKGDAGDKDEDDEESGEEDDDGEKQAKESHQLLQPVDILDLDIILADDDAAVATTTQPPKTTTQSAETATQANQQPSSSSNWNKYNPKMLRKPKKSGFTHRLTITSGQFKHMQFAIFNNCIA